MLLIYLCMCEVCGLHGLPLSVCRTSAKWHSRQWNVVSLVMRNSTSSLSRKEPESFSQYSGQATGWMTRNHGLTPGRSKTVFVPRLGLGPFQPSVQWVPGDPCQGMKLTMLFHLMSMVGIHGAMPPLSTGKTLLPPPKIKKQHYFLKTL
jgi:hypothetical protein